jgi:uncharacterized membrane protein YeaQ/YmgE (transglycosylase-associated protein family)
MLSSLISFLLIGLVAGWLAGLIMKSRGQSLVVNLIVGCIGAFVGHFLFMAIGLHAYGLLAELICDTIGAVVLIFLIRYLNRNARL